MHKKLCEFLGRGPIYALLYNKKNSVAYQSSCPCTVEAEVRIYKRSKKKKEIALDHENDQEFFFLLFFVTFFVESVSFFQFFLIAFLAESVFSCFHFLVFSYKLSTYALRCRSCRGYLFTWGGNFFGARKYSFLTSCSSSLALSL